MTEKFISLSQLEDHVSLKTPIRILIPKTWLIDYRDISEELIWVEVTYVEKPGDIHSDCKYVWFMTKEHGKSVSLLGVTLVEVRMTLETNVNLGYGKGQTVRGISID